MIVLDMLRDVFAPLDGSWHTLSRIRLLIDSDSFRAYVEDSVSRRGGVVFWYDRDLLADHSIDLLQYTAAIEQIYGCAGVVTIVDHEPPSYPSTALAVAREQYVKSLLIKLKSFDVVMYCISPDNESMAQRDRKIQSIEELDKGGQVLGPFDSETSREPWILECAMRGLTLAVVRFLAPYGTNSTTIPKRSTPGSYRWEPEHRVASFYL